ncbi:general stress protein, partial [Sporosarcina sp. P16b]
MAKNDQNERNQNDGSMTVEEAGRKGGEATSR